MQLSLKQYSSKHQSAGFSLLELLVVVSILVAIASIGMTNYGNINEEKRDELTRIELAELADALRQLHTDTGFWPGTTGGIPRTDPYDWSVLTDTSLTSWDAVSKHGWRGPYILKKLDKDVTGDSSIALTGLDSGSTGDHGPIDTALLDPYNGPYVLLVLDSGSGNRNVIVSQGRDGVFNELGGSGTEAELYETLCTADYSSDDMVACP